MRKIVMLGVLASLASAVPAYAVDYAPAPAPTPTSHKCKVHSVGYNATGTLVASALTANGKGRYSGTLEVQVTRANHRGPTGTRRSRCPPPGSSSTTGWTPRRRPRAAG